MLLRPERRRPLSDAKIIGAYLAGTSSGAVLTALMAWLLSGFTEPLGNAWRLSLLAGLGVFVWLCKHGPLSGVVALPEARRQIPAEVFGGGLTRGAYRFGFELGTGVRTYVPSAAPYLVLITVVLTQPTIAMAILIGLGFGLGRAIPLMVRLLQSGPSGARRYLPRTGSAAQTTATLLVLMGGLSLV